MMKPVHLVILSLFASTARAAEQNYEMVPSPDKKTGIEFHLPYSMGTHDGQALDISGSITFDPSKPSSAHGSFKVPIRSLRTGNETRDCHMLEALAIDYKKSKYPIEHVCPAIEPGSIAYPDIEFKVKSLQMTEGTVSTVDGEWIIHGVTRPVSFSVKVTPEGNGFRLTGTSLVSLKAHNVVVKSARILVVDINVEDTATVQLDLHFRPRN